MDSAAKHVHVGGVYFITFAASLYVVQFLLRLFTARHANNPIARGLAFGI